MRALRVRGRLSSRTGGWTALFLATAIASFWLAPSARAETEVDVALVLAVDISFSMDTDEQELQRAGFVEALRSPEVHEAIGRGLIGQIAVTYFEWAGVADRHVIVPWTLIDGPESAIRFAEDLEFERINRARRTSIASAIDFGLDLMEESGVRALRRVIDVSGDGPNNEGPFVTAARDRAIARGVTVNGLPIMLKRPGYLDIEHLDQYYIDCVIGGPGAFVVPVRSPGEFIDAIRTKLVLEIAGEIPPRPLIRLAQAEAPADCMIGERQWEYRNRF
ncbi:DUF1194 domain-containing protein [Salinarimonas ramus]|uniref:DUF1194 domain-containing protein n=1 Tax=Salinarimonas ramus TaxID=690164 RepID=A0A917V3H9_9HYPH|nr:DUF1194 domain-containing protein [Salinarimonas ramus]GGK31819.1 hypothetical protein GCM10011322_18010 [Salinarimonas ramus]